MRGRQTATLRRRFSVPLRVHEPIRAQAKQADNEGSHLDNVLQQGPPAQNKASVCPLPAHSVSPVSKGAATADPRVLRRPISGAYIPRTALHFHPQVRFQSPSPRLHSKSKDDVNPPPRSGPRTIVSETATVKYLLDNRADLKSHVVELFHAVAGGCESMDIAQLKNFVAKLSRRINVFEAAFGNLSLEHSRFDFDGKGTIHFTEVYKLVKHRLHIHLKKLGGVAKLQIPTKSLEEAGYTILKELGRGSQAVAKLAKENSTGNHICLKVYSKNGTSITGVAELMEEFETMQKFSYDVIARCYGIFQDDMSYYVTTEAYYGGDLSTLSRRAIEQGTHFSENYWRRLWRQCFEALTFLHRSAVMHCDVKEQNIMLRTASLSSPDVVLIDFGLSRAMAADEPGMISGTPGYIPPETWESGAWFPTGDVFSMGVTILQVLLDRVAEKDWIFGSGDFHTHREIKQATATRVPPFDLLPPEMPGLRCLLEKMLQKDLNKRPRAPCMLGDTWLWEEIMQPEAPAAAVKRRAWFSRLFRKPRPLPGPSPDDFFATVIDDATFKKAACNACAMANTGGA